MEVLEYHYSHHYPRIRKHIVYAVQRYYLLVICAGGIQHLVALLEAGPSMEVLEYAAAALGNLAAGGQQIKDAMRLVCQPGLNSFGLALHLLC